MVRDYIDQWLEESEENRRLYAQEELIVEASDCICDELERQNLSRATLAERLGRSKAYVTQMLNGSRNMTLRTLADAAYALGKHVRIQFEDPDESENWTDDAAVTPYRRKLMELAAIEAANTDWTDIEVESG